jgi:hypothetical protein
VRRLHRKKAGAMVAVLAFSSLAIASNLSSSASAAAGVQGYEVSAPAAVVVTDTPLSSETDPSRWRQALQAFADYIGS